MTLVLLQNTPLAKYRPLSSPLEAAYLPRIFLYLLRYAGLELIMYNPLQNYEF